MFAHLQRAVDAIFMKAIAPVSTGEISAIDPVELAVAFSGRQTIRIIHRMMVMHLAMDFIWVNGPRQV